MAHTRKVIEDPVAEGTTPVLTATFTSDGSTPISTPLSLAELRLYDMRSGNVINSKSAVDLLPFISGGVLTYQFEVGDTPIVNADALIESHVARITFEWLAGARRGVHEVEHRVVNLT